MPTSTRAEPSNAPSTGLASARASLYDELERGVPPLRAISNACTLLTERARGAAWALVRMTPGEPPRVLTSGPSAERVRRVQDGLAVAPIAPREVRWGSASRRSAEGAGHLLTWGIAPAIAEGLVLVAVVDTQGGDPVAAEEATELLGPPVELAVRLYVAADPAARGAVVEPGARHAERLESLAGLAGGVAHELNNQLTAILGNLSLARERSPAASTAPLLDAAQRAVDRAGALSQQLLAFSGRGRFAVRPESVNDAIEAIAPRLRLLTPPGCTLRLGLATGLSPVELDSAQFQQAVLQLVQNAVEAMDGRGGTIWLRTFPEQLAEGELTAPGLTVPLPAGSYVRVEVADGGPGIPPEVLARMFDPFFSTKGHGRGLGLSAVLGIARGHGGAIVARSEPGRGSRLDLYIPALRTLPDDRVTVPRPILRGRVLLVDDDPIVRSAVTEMLRQLHLTVVEAADGVEAVERFRAERGQLSLVLLDLVMPRMDGSQTWRELRAIDPTVPVVLCTGYDNRDSPTPIPGAELAGTLWKPFDRAALERVVSAALRRRESR